MVQIAQHAHCVICGKAIDSTEKTCGGNCALALEQNVKKRNQFKWLMYLAMGLAVSLLIMQLLGRV